MPVFIAKYNEHRDNLSNDLSDPSALLGTIKIPRNLSLLTERLPKAQYESDKKQEEEQKFAINRLQVIREEEDVVRLQSR
jgi:hypothetical protein